MRTRLDPVIRKVLYVPRVPDRAVYPREQVVIAPSIYNLLAKPTWSVSSLLPPDEAMASKSDTDSGSTSTHSTTEAAAEDEITPAKLRHLLRLSALLPPSTSKEEAELLKSLRTHIHFVRAVRSVDTTGVEPLITIRDETTAGIAEKTITLDKLQRYLDQEEKIGINGTVRRGTNGNVDLADDATEKKDWRIDLWKLNKNRAERRRGKYLMVRRQQKPKVAADEVKPDPVVQAIHDPPEQSKNSTMIDLNIPQPSVQETTRSTETG